MTLDRLFSELNKLALEKSYASTFGIFCGAFLEKDPVITQKIIPFIESSINCQRFHSIVMRAHTDMYETDRKRILREYEAKPYNPSSIAFYAPQLEHVNKKLAIRTYQDLIKHIEDDINEFPGILEILNNEFMHIHGKADQSYIRNNYTSYFIGSLLYSRHELSRRRMDILDFKYSTVVLDEYSKIGINLEKEDPQFSKYRLLKLNADMRINNDKDSQTISDNRINKYFWINVPRKLLSTIEELIENKFISDISFRVDYVSDLIPIWEEMEVGSPLKIKVSILPDLSKFYSSENYNNNLWVRHDKEKSSLTFEELVEDFEIIGNDIVTQVVHLEYKLENDTFLITHLDHELIIYTLEAYEKRLLNPYERGYRKIKTFKIDNSCIPFHFKQQNEYFLFQILDAYFKNTDLISEYFENV